MDHKYDEHLEDQFEKLAEERLAEMKYKVFDKDARIIKRDKFYDLKLENRTDDENCLVIISKEGETIVLTTEIEQQIYAIYKMRHGKD